MRHAREKAGVRSGERGFSSIEVMFCLTFFSIAFLSTASTTVSFSKMRKLNSETQTAVAAAKNQMETIRGTTFAQIIATFNNANFQVDLDGVNGYDLAAQDADADGNAGNVTITQVGPASDPGSLLQIDVVVAWRGVAGNRQVQLTELIANRAGT